MTLHDTIKKWISETLNIGGEFSLEYPTDFSHGDFASNIALIEAKRLGKNPRQLAEEYAEKFRANRIPEIFDIEAAGPGFLNFTVEPAVFSEAVEKITVAGPYFGEHTHVSGKKVMVEYTDPNPFKEFHIGHFMSNAIGESIARLIESTGTEVVRANWQGDVGMHVAAAVWGIRNLGIDVTKATAADLGWAYATGATQAKENEKIKEEVAEINTHIFAHDDEEINRLYDAGRKISLDYFETIYARLGTKFDHYFFESEEGAAGKSIVEEFMAKGVFEKSDGAVIFPGEKHGLHTRVFVNSRGLPTYEAKELGLNKKKFEVEPLLDQSIIITGNEITDYFKVLMRVMSLVMPEVASRTKHIPHGMLRLPTGKMSSRTGDVITATSLIDAVKEEARKKIKAGVLGESKIDKIAEAVALAALKYSILRQAIGGNIIFDMEKSLSLEGDSGPYLQYATVRAGTVLKKAEGQVTASARLPRGWKTTHLERLLERYPRLVAKAAEDFAPHQLVTYLTTLAGEFNSFYAAHRIIDPDDITSPYKLALTRAFFDVSSSGLHLLGITVPEEM